jgi:glycosyltransferase involved in cell wall biosynthesis
MNGLRPLLSIVIPAYNEAGRLPATMARVLEYRAARKLDAELIVVDDGSSDRTLAAAREVAAGQAGVRVIANDHRGKGYTVRTGMLAGDGRYLLFCDADLATPIDEWEKLYERLEAGYDIAIGSREGLGARRLGEPAHRHLMGRVFNMIVQAVAVGGIQDTQCGFKAFRREVGRELFASVRLYGPDAPRLRGAAVTAFDVELLFLARKRGYRIAEVPVEWHYGSETKVDPVRDSLRNLRDVLRVRLNDLRGYYPVAVEAVSQE